MTDTLGTADIKKVLDAVFGVYGAIEGAKAAGPLNLNDLALLLPLLPTLEAAAAGSGMVIPEFKALDAPAAEDLLAYVMAKLSIGDAAAKAKIEAGLSLAEATYAFILAMKA